MHWLQTTFSNRFNRFTGERGHVFQGRYKALLVEPGAHFTGVVNYVHLNPVRALNEQLRKHGKASKDIQIIDVTPVSSFRLRHQGESVSQYSTLEARYISATRETVTIERKDD